MESSRVSASAAKASPTASSSRSSGSGEPGGQGLQGAGQDGSQVPTSEISDWGLDAGSLSLRNDQCERGLGCQLYLGSLQCAILYT